MPTSVKYKGSVIADLNDEQTATLKTAGKLMEADIVVEAAKGGGGECDLPHIIEVDVLPTENISETDVYLCDGKYYKWVNEFSDVWITADGMSMYFSEYVTTMGGSVSFHLEATKPTEDIAVSSESGFAVYYIVDENNLFLYGDFEGSGQPIWVTLSDMMGIPYGGAITDTSEATESGMYALVSTGFQAYIHPEGTLLVYQGGVYDVTEKASVNIKQPTVYVCRTEGDLPSDAPVGSIAFVTYFE